MKFTLPILPLQTILFLIFLVLKLTKQIDWSWWFVAMPLYAIPAMFFAASIGVFIAGLIVAVSKFYVNRKR